MTGTAVATGRRGQPVLAVLTVLGGLPRVLVVSLLRAYRLVVSPLYGPTCRFHPTCSQYALTAVERHGVVRGGGLAAWRLLRCNPWNAGGIDDVPAVTRQDGPGRPGRDAHRDRHTTDQLRTDDAARRWRTTSSDRHEGTHRWTS